MDTQTVENMGMKPEDKTSGTRTITLAEMGDTLPIGTSDKSGALHRLLAAREWDLDVEMELGDQRDKHRDHNVAQYISMVITSVCTKIGNADFEGMSPQERRLFLSQMWQPDVFYAWVWLRVQCLGADLNLELRCPACRNNFPFVADLNTVKIGTTDNLEATKWRFKLSKPIELRKKKLEEVVLGPTRWSTLENAAAVGLNTGKAKAEIILGSIHEYVGYDPMVVTIKELGKMTKRDFERMTSEISDRTLGPDMRVEDKCPKCGYGFNLPIDWDYDSFFGTSSPS